MLKKHPRLRGEPGKRASYSNLGYLVLGEVIQAASGASYIHYVREHILEPLGITMTDFMYRPDMSPLAATGYHPRFNVSTPALRRMTPAGIFEHRVGKLWALSRFCVQGAPYGGLIGPVRDVVLGVVAMGNGTNWDHLRLVHAATQGGSDRRGY